VIKFLHPLNERVAKERHAVAVLELEWGELLRLAAVYYAEGEGNAEKCLFHGGLLGGIKAVLGILRKVFEGRSKLFGGVWD
jgi:hypothetical protein